MAQKKEYQVFNNQNKQWVKMINGEIQECSHFPFKGVKKIGDQSKKLNGHEENESPRQPAPEMEENNKQVQEESSGGGWGSFFT